jgi:hypothetical protein
MGRFSYSNECLVYLGRFFFTCTLFGAARFGPSAKKCESALQRSTYGDDG